MSVKKIAIIVTTIVVSAVWLYFVIDVNMRFPAANVEYYTKDNPAKEGALVVTPISAEIMMLDEYIDKYGDSSVEHIVTYDNTRIIVTAVNYKNISSEKIDVLTYKHNCVVEPSKFANGSFPINDSEMKVSLEPGENITVYTQAIAGGALLTKKTAKNLENETINLIYSYYPVEKHLVFDM